MDVFTFIVLVVLISCGTGLAREWLKRRSKAKPEDPRLAGEVEALRRRVEALESIVTDRRYRLDRELDSLDGERPAASG